MKQDMHRAGTRNAGGLYDDIIDLPHHVSRKHPQMSREMRAAQFSPFAALTGYDAELDAALKKEIAEIESMVQGVQIDEA